MRLSAALTSLGAALLHAVPLAAQTSTTTDVYDPPLLTAAGNVTGLPGGNEFCGAQRVRKPWGALSLDEQALYLEASRLAIANGAVAEFAAIAADSLGQAQGECSCAFFSWHRRFLLAYESYLRELDDRFACLTVPYYDVHTAYIQSVNGDCTNMFDCSGIFQAIGGPPQNSTEETSLTFNGVNATGYATVGTPYGDVCTGNDNDEDNCGSYVVRDDVSSKTVPSAASFGSFQSVVATSGDYATFLQGIQYGVHHEVLDAIGGVFATAAAAYDVLYYSWYAALDMYLHVYHLCRIGVPLTYDQIVESLEVYANATQSCGGVDGVDAQSPLLMRITVDGQVVDVSQHPTLGRYFGYVGSDSWNYADIQQLGDYSYTYQLPEMLRQQILSNNDMCTGFNRAFAATYTSLNATAVKSTMTSRTTTKTTTTKTTRIVNGKKVTTTKVTKTVTRANSTTTSPAARSTVMTGQLVSQYGYAYLGNFSTDDEAFGEGTYVTNGYTGYTAYYSAGAITTKHNGIVSANFISSSSSPSTSAPMSSSTSARVDATYSNTSNVVMYVTVGKSLVARNITASVATSGSYWAWLQTAYDGLYSRFDGNVDLVATHMKLLECYTFNSVYGLSNFTSTFVTNKNLVTNRVQCGQRLDLVRSGLLQLAVRSSAYTAESLRFASSTVISTIRSSYRRVTSRQVTYIRRSYTERVRASLDSAQESLNNITIITNGGFGENETSTTVVDTGYVISNSSSTEAKSSGDTTAITTTTTTTTAAGASDKISEVSPELTESDVAESTVAPKDLDVTAPTDSWT
uniref:Tyrosinase copper-binding domain-containing protein n=1 Tax=Hyaloperonospora arabidopsidis (strain Emoy2) TaxID=559515 RepID=M4C6D4_HYAAE